METITVQKRTGLFWIWLSIVVIVLDQITKYLITTALAFHESIYLLPVLNITLAQNKGAAFSFLSEVGSVATLIFIVTAVVISSILCVWMHRLPFKSTWLGVSLALILGGALGNLIDRIRFGYVVDFIHFHIQNWSWPIFNVADIAITTGAIMLIIDIFKKKP